MVEEVGSHDAARWADVRQRATIKENVDGKRMISLLFYRRNGQPADQPGDLPIGGYRI